MPLLFERSATDERAHGSARAVSVVVRAASAEGGVKTTVESALALAHSRAPDTELVLVHDCADRTTWEWLLELKRAHPELHLIDFGEPYGDQLARLEGARRAQYSHVCFAGSGADPDALARAVRDAVPRSRAIAVLQEGLGATAEERLVVQCFAPGVTLPTDHADAASLAPDPRRSSGRRRIGMLLAGSSVFLVVTTALLAVRDQASSEAVASPGGLPAVPIEARLDRVSVGAATPVVPELAAPTSLQGPTRPTGTSRSSDTVKPAKERAATPEPDEISSAAAPAGEPATDWSPDPSSPAPTQSDSRPDKGPPAESGHAPSPTQESAPGATSGAETLPVSTDPSTPAAVTQTAPPLGAASAQDPGSPTPAAPPPPAVPPASPPAPPPALPTDTGPGNGNGNGNANGHANGNGQGNGNGPKK